MLYRVTYRLARSEETEVRDLTAVAPIETDMAEAWHFDLPQGTVIEAFTLLQAPGLEIKKPRYRVSYVLDGSENEAEVFALEAPAEKLTATDPVVFGLPRAAELKSVELI